MKNRSVWPKTAYYWQENGELYISVPFTWELPKVIKKLGFDKVHIGGPAVDLIPDYFKDYPNVVQVGGDMPGVLQRINPSATRTTVGCVRRCKFCGIGQGLIEPGGFHELEDWPDLPVITDNNLLAASPAHFDRVMDRLEKHTQVDINQGIDARLVNEYHAERLARLKFKRRGLRLALDNMGGFQAWALALDSLIKSGTPIRALSSYALIGFDSGPDEAWKRCQLIESLGVRVLPMWFHTLNALELNEVTKDQLELGWNDFERRRIMGWYYQHKVIKR